MRLTYSDEDAYTQESRTRVPRVVENVIYGFMGCSGAWATTIWYEGCLKQSCFCSKRRWRMLSGWANQVNFDELYDKKSSCGSILWLRNGVIF